MAGLAEAIQGAVGQPASVRIGTVDSTSPLTISAQGVTFNDVGILGDYAPLIGDSVALLGQSSGVGSDPASWLALGAVHGALTPSIEPVLLNGWVQFGFGFGAVSHWRDASGVVHLEGLLQGGTTAAGTPLFVLPDGSRPSARLVFGVISNNAFARVDVDVDGTVLTEAGVSAAWISLCGISFRAMPYVTVPA